jgi:hypothetical protein
MNELATITRPQSVGSISGNVVVPAAIGGAGEHAARRFHVANGYSVLPNLDRMRAAMAFESAG